MNSLLPIIDLVIIGNDVIICNNEIKTGHDDIKRGSNELIEQECCFGSDSCSDNRYSSDACMISLSSRCSTVTVALIVLFQGIYGNPPLCSRQANQPGSAGSIGPCKAPDAIYNPPDVHGLSQAAPLAAGGVLSGGVWALARPHGPHPLQLRTPWAHLHLSRELR